MAENQPLRDVSCPHCRKPFRSAVLAADSAHAGFKCPHCQLYIPLARVENGKNAA
jgi:DNA-directed RNA polymerase subunit RPC12/RpoP